MNPVLIYQNEAALDFNNKFSINFVDNDVVNYVKFFKKNQYYIGSLNCNITKGNKTKTTFEGSKDHVDKLSKLSRELLTKGAAFKNDINYLSTSLTQNFYLPDIAPQKYKLVLDATVISNNSYSYQFYDVVDKRQKFARIYSPFLHFQNGFIFRGEKTPNKDKELIIKLIDKKKIQYIFSQPPNYRWKIEKNLYRDYNAKFIKIKSVNGTNKWAFTNPGFFLRAEERAIRKVKINPPNFMFTLYYSQGYQKEESGTFDVIGSSFHQLPYYRPFVQLSNERVDIQYNRRFLIFGLVDKKQLKPFESVIDNCTFVGNYELTDKDRKFFEWAFPDFSFKYLGEYYGDGVDDWKTNDIFFPSAADTYTEKYKKSVFDPRKHFMKFVCENKKYKDIFNTNSEIFFYDSEKTLPTTADECEKLFDKDVLEIKKLVNDIGQPKEIPEYEQINLGLYDESAIIEETYIQRINRQIQLYGLISIPFAHTKKSHLVSLKNLLPFRVSFDVEKNNIIFGLSYLEEKKKIITNDKKIHNLSIICVENEKKMSVVEKEVTIEALQAFDKYQKLNPIDIKITDSDLFRELTVISNRRIMYKFIPNTILLSSSIQQETEVIFFNSNWT